MKVGTLGAIERADMPVGVRPKQQRQFLPTLKIALLYNPNHMAVIKQIQSDSIVQCLRVESLETSARGRDQLKKEVLFIFQTNRVTELHLLQS
jgi:hypothetical protein